MKFRIQLAAVAFVSMALVTQIAHAEPGYSNTGPSLISNVTVIDGLGNLPVMGQDIAILEGKIAAIGATGTVQAPEGATMIDGTGLTAIPGLMDLHVHLQGGWANGLIEGERYEVRRDDASVQQRLNGYVYGGVTTVLDMGNDHDWVLEKREKITNGELFGPRFFAVGGAWSQAPSGWDAGSTDAGSFNSSTKIDDLSKIPEQVARYKADGIEIIKLYAGISTVAMQALIEEAHKQDMLTVSDLWMLNLNRQIMQTTGLDGWAHSGGFSVASESDQYWMAENNRFVIGTANVGEKLGGMRVKDENGARLMLKQPLIVDIWGEEEVTEFYDVYADIRENFYEGKFSFYQSNNFGDLSEFRDNFLTNIKGSYDAGVLLACGTDDVYASMWPGESTHREMELLVMAGIPELDAIKACTSDSARVLRRETEIGALLPGLSADIVLVSGNPANNIADSRNVEHVFMRGNQVDRESLKLAQ